jgi:hypothetical protein
VAAAASARGLEARTFDICHGPDEDITTSSGFVKAMRLVLQLKKNGLLAMAPVCSSFVFPPSSVTAGTRTTLQATRLSSASGMGT